MASVARRVNPLVSSIPHILTWRKFGFRTICSGRLGFAPYTSTSSSPAPADSNTPLTGTKVLETFTEELEIGSGLITLETGKRARYANGAVVFGMGETKVLSTVCSSKSDGVRDFLPLTVDYEEKQFARAVIPNTYMRREGAPKERELLCGRLIDRPIRPLFPPGFYHEVQVLASVLSSDGNQDPDVMAANATSAALMLSDIPWNGPIGVIRIGRVCGQFIVNPSMDELSLSDLNLVYACTRDKTLMMDVQAREISEKDLEAALRLAHPEAVKYLEPQIRLAKKAGKHKEQYSLYLMPEKSKEKIRNLSEGPIEAVFTDPKYGKFERGKALDKITQDVKRALEEECDEEGLKVLSKTVDTVRKEVIRKRIMSEGLRVDGRLLDEVRPIYCEAGDLPALHGSSLFSRGDTQVSCTVTKGAPEEAQRLDSLVGPSTKRFMLHYSFPPFCTNEVGKRVGLNRREVGHGTLAEKALLAVLPPEDVFPYTVRVNSVVMASDGSTSMATVCGGSLALMDAGIPLREHVAGLSVGLVSETDSSTGEITDYRILTDILGLEDHVGDMDFKIAGTRNGVTAIQLDIKPAGIPLDIICESLEPARKGRIQILAHLEREIDAPRCQNDRNSPRLAMLKYSNDAIRRLIGPLGVLKRKIEEETGGMHLDVITSPIQPISYKNTGAPLTLQVCTGARISVGDGTLYINAKNQAVMEKVQEKIELTVGREIEVGGIYRGVVTTVKEYGAFVEFNGGQQGLLHVSELSHEPVTRVSDVVSIGQKLSLMCIGQDVRGNIKLSLKATLPRTGSKAESAVQRSEAPVKQEANSWASSSEEESVEQEKQDSQSEDEPLENQSDGADSTSPAIVIRSAAECDEGEDRPAASLKSSNPASRNSKKIKKERFNTNFVNEDACTDNSYSRLSQSEVNDMDAEQEAPMSARKLKIGMELKAKVHQIRARGLVLDLGGGLRGMYRFETGAKTDVVVGEELQVKCLSFSSKGIPVFSLAKGSV